MRGIGKILSFTFFLTFTVIFIGTVIAFLAGEASCDAMIITGMIAILSGILDVELKLSEGRERDGKGKANE